MSCHCSSVFAVILPGVLSIIVLLVLLFLLSQRNGETESGGLLNSSDFAGNHGTVSFTQAGMV